jgi:ribose-phosphate pyrophosphokinase
MPRRHDRTARCEADEPLVFGGSTSPRLTEAICRELSAPVGANETMRFSDGNLFVRVLENVRGRSVFIVQSTVFPTNASFMELLFWIDALKRASAASVTAVVPYFSYAKGDKKDEPRVSIRARVCADAVEAAGADRVVTMDLHAPQIQGFFRVPVDDLYGEAALCDAVGAENLGAPIVVAPDAGSVKRARRFARRLRAPLAIADKQRFGHQEQVERVGLLGNVDGRDAVIIDDFTVTGGTLIEAAAELVSHGARSVRAAVTHGVFADGCMEAVEASPIERLYCTDTIETQPERLSRKVEIASVAPLFAEAIRRIHGRESISSLFLA